MANVQRIDLIFPGQRKPQSYVVYPKQDGDQGHLLIQSDKACGLLDPATGNFRYQPKSQYPIMLDSQGKQNFLLDADTIKKIADAQPKKGDTIANGVGIIG